MWIRRAEFDAVIGRAELAEETVRQLRRTLAVWRGRAAAAERRNGPWAAGVRAVVDDLLEEARDADDRAS